METDAELLRRYVEDRTETAFAELVRRHVDLVYAVALRQVGGDAHLARDVTQRVFTDVARKAKTLRHHPVLAGWLHRSAHFAASDLVRAERRRRAREQEAQLMQNVERDGVVADSELLKPLVDEAVTELREHERDAIALRFFEARSFAEIGAALRVSEDAARMRVERALEKLRAALERRGITSTAAALGVVLGNQVAAKAPVGLAAEVAVKALGAAPVIWTAAALVQVGVVAVVLAGLATAGVQQERAQTKLRAELGGLQEMRSELERVRAENTRLARADVEVGQLRRGDAERVRLREEMAGLNERLARKARAVAISGSVKNAGRILMPEGAVTTLAEAIRQAGGTTYLAKASGVRITRRAPDGSLRVFQANLEVAQEAAFVVEPEDVIFVPERIL